MPSYFIQGSMSIEPATHPDDVAEALNRYGARLTGRNANEGGKVFWVSETVDGPTPEAAVATLKTRIGSAVVLRRGYDQVQRFTVGTFVAEHISDWLPDDESGGPQLGRARWLV